MDLVSKAAAAHQRRSGRATKKPKYFDENDDDGSSNDSTSIRHHHVSNKSKGRSSLKPAVAAASTTGNAAKIADEAKKQSVGTSKQVATVAASDQPAVSITRASNSDDDIIMVSPPPASTKKPIVRHGPPVGLQTVLIAKSGKKILKLASKTSKGVVASEITLASSLSAENAPENADIAVNGNAGSGKPEPAASSPASVVEQLSTSTEAESSHSGIPASTFFAAASSAKSTGKSDGKISRHGRAARDATMRKINALTSGYRNGKDDTDDEDQGESDSNATSSRSRKQKKPADDVDYAQNSTNDEETNDDDDADESIDEADLERVQHQQKRSSKQQKHSSKSKKRGRNADREVAVFRAPRSSGRRAAAAATEAMANAFAVETSASSHSKKAKKRRSSSAEDDSFAEENSRESSTVAVNVSKKRRRNGSSDDSDAVEEEEEDDEPSETESDYSGEKSDRRTSARLTAAAAADRSRRKRSSKKKASSKKAKSKPSKPVAGRGGGAGGKKKPSAASKKSSNRDADDDDSDSSERKEKKADLDYASFNNPFKKAAKMKVVTPLEQRLDDMLNSLSKQVSLNTGEAVFSASVEENSSAAARGGPKSHRDKRHSQHVDDAEEEEEADHAAESSSASFAGPVLFETSPPYIKGGKMRDYQVRGLNFMMDCLHHSLNPILADEMGLGKTLQTIALFGYYVEIMKTRRPFLVIAPKSTLHNWMREIAKWCPSLHALCLIGEKHERPDVIKAWFRANDPAGLKRHRFPALKKKKFSSDEDEDDDEPEDAEETEENLVVEIEKNDAETAEAEKNSFADKPIMKAADIIAAARANPDNKPYHILVTSYEMCLYEKCFLKKQPWEILVIDEAHRIKNEQSKLSETVRQFSAKHRVLLTGTPLQNNLRELWALLNFLKPELFVSAEEFEEYFNLSGEKQDFLIKKLHAILRPFMLRRLKSEVEKGLPPKKEVRVYVPMSDLQRKMYKQMLIDKRTAWHPKAGDAAGKKSSRKVFNNIIMQLRKICNHPYLFDDVDPSPPDVDPADDNLTHVVNACGKLEFIDKLLTRLKTDGHRVLLFSQMTRLLDILDDYCRWRKYEYCRIDGNTDHISRQEQIEEYNAPNSSKFLFLLSTRAGGLGINLATADVVIIYDSDWNPQVDFQAIDRAHRIGQTRPVRVFRFVTDGTVEEGVIKRAEMKRRLDNVVIQQGRLAQAQAAAASKEELREILRASAASTLAEDAKIGAGGTTLRAAEMDIDAVLAKSETRTAELDKKLDEMGESQLQKFSLDVDDASINAYQFEGRDFKVNDKIKRQLWAGYGETFIQQQNLVDAAAAAGQGGARRRRAAVYAAQMTGEMTELDYAYVAYAQACQHNGTPLIPKLVHHDISSWHFPPQRLLELREKEMNFFKRTIEYEPKANDEDFEDEDEEFDENVIDVEDDDDDDDDEAEYDSDFEGEKSAKKTAAAEQQADGVGTAAVVSDEVEKLPKTSEKKSSYKKNDPYLRKKQAQNRKRSKFETALRKIRQAQPLSEAEQIEKRSLEQLQDAKGYYGLDSKFFSQFKDALSAIDWHHKHEDRKADEIIKLILQLARPSSQHRYEYVLRQKRDLLRRYYCEFAEKAHTLPGWSVFKQKLDRSSTKRTQEEQSTRALVWYVNAKCGGPLKMGRSSVALVQAKSLFIMDSPLMAASSAANSSMFLSGSALINNILSKKIDLCSDAEDVLILYYAYTSGKSPNDSTNLPNLILQAANNDDSLMSFNSNILRKLTIEDVRERLKKLVRKLCDEYVRHQQPEVNVALERVTMQKMKRRFQHVWKVADRLPMDDLEKLLKCAVKTKNKTLSENIMQSNAIRHMETGAMLPQSPLTSPPPPSLQKDEQLEIDDALQQPEKQKKKEAEKNLTVGETRTGIDDGEKPVFFMLSPPLAKQHTAAGALTAGGKVKEAFGFGVSPPAALVELWQAQRLPV